MLHLGDYPITQSFPLHWGEMDALGHANNVAYFRYFETARIAYFDAIGYLTYLRAHRAGPILAETTCRFRRPLEYPDMLTVGATVDAVDRDRFTMLYALYSERLEDIAARGNGLIVHFDYAQGSKAPLPAIIRQAISSLQPT